MQFPTSVFAEEITDYSETYDDSYVEGTSAQDGSFDEWDSGENSYVGDETGYGDDYSDGQYGEDLSTQEGLSDVGGDYDEGGYAGDETGYGDDDSDDQDGYTDGDLDGESDGSYDGESEDEIPGEIDEEELEEEGSGEISENAVLEGTGDFFYENSSLSMTVHVSGSVELPTAYTEIIGGEDDEVGDEAIESEVAGVSGAGSTAAAWDDITMTVSMLDPDSASYALLQAYAEDKSEDVAALFGMDIDFYYEDTELDMSDCYITADITPAEEVIEEAIAESESEISTLSADDEEDKGTVSVTVQIVEISDEGVTELDSESVTEDDPAPTMTVGVDVDNDYGIMVLSEGDPEFTVQFYANLDTIYRSHQAGDTDLTVIETHTDSGAVLPSNSGSSLSSYNTSVIELKDDGSGNFVMDSENVLTQMYEDESYEFALEPDVHSMNKVETNSDYRLIEIWKLNEDGDPNSEDNNNNDWTVYSVERIEDTDDYTKQMTNNKDTYDASPDEYILVEDDDVFRFVYDTTSNVATLDANFFDYNISDGNVYAGDSTSSGTWSSGTKYLYTTQQGINNAANYSNNGGVKLAVGNNNTGSGSGTVTWNGNELNKYNSNGLLGCTFGLAISLDTDTNAITYGSGIDAPGLFGGAAVGEKEFANVQLNFNREGDTYTLSSVSGSDGVGVSGLETFENPGSYTNIYTNSFWPLDGVSYDGMDPLFGGSSDVRHFGNNEGNMPASDDGTDHNSYFGMNFEIEFSYTSDYVGPLEYFFFGDDDMWVFLDDQLILDIGGVHSSVGEHVDLWDYLSQDAQPTADDGEPTIYTHTLSVFYTERGASGSTCYIQYTLPEVSSVTPVEDASNLIIEKEVEGATTDQEFTFTINLQNADGSTNGNQYSAIVTNDSGLYDHSTIIRNGDTFTLKDGWNMVIRNLPNGTIATVTETRVPGYSTTYEVGEYTGQTVTTTGSGTTATGTVIADDTTYIKFINSTDTPGKDIDADGDGEYGDSGMQANVGDTLEYKIEYVNDTGETVRVTITDVLDVGLDFVSADNGGTYDESTRTVTWVLEDVETGAPISVTFKATINENALIINEIENTAKIQVNGDPEVETNPVYTPVPDKDVDADEDGEYGDSGEEVQVGDTLKYKIEYQNSYDDPATVTITDVLDVGLDFVEASDGGTYDESTRTITWVFEEVEAHTGGSVTFTATVNKNALTENEITNDATVGVDNDYIVTNEVDNPVPDKDVDADGDGEYGDSGVEVQVGDTLTYIIHYDNGYDKPSVVTITDTLDEGLTYVEGSASNGGTYDEDTRTISWTIESVEAHTDGYVTFQAIVNENAWEENEVKNTGTVKIGDVEKVTNTVYNPVPHKDVDIHGDGSYGDSGLQVQVGDILTYKVSYFNGDEENSATVTITDVLDVGLDFVSADNGGTYDEDTRTITWVIEEVPAQTGGDVTFQAIVNKNALVKHEVDNKATVQVGETSQETNTVYNPVPSKDVDTDGDGEGGDAGMSVNVGDTLTYTIYYQNGYDTPATVTITDKLDTGLDFVSADNGGTYDEDTRTITWTIEDVEAYVGGSVSFQATVNETALFWNEVSNTAGVQVGEEHEVVYTNTVENPVPHKDVDINPEDGLDYGDSGLEVKVGYTLTYKIDYENPGDTEAVVTITDVLDVGLDFVSADNDGTYDEDTRTITWVLEDVPARTNGSVTFMATVNENALEELEVVNSAIVQVGDYPEMETNEVENPVLAEPKISKEIAEDDYERKEDSGEEMHPGEDTDGDGWGSWDDADNNQEVTYHLKLTDIRKATSLVVHDYLEDGLDFEPETVEISLYDNGAETKLTEGTDYTLTQGTCSDPDCPMDGCTYEVEFEDYLFEDISSDAYLMVTYKALTDTHEEDYDDYEDDLMNYSYMSYEVYDYGLQTLSVRRTAVVSTETDLFGFGVYKYSMEDGEEIALSGAEFTLERSGVYATFEIEYDGETGEPYYMVAGWEEDASAAGTLVSDKDGLIRIEGLDDDTYTLTETKAPIGYEIVDETITVMIDEYGVVTVEGDTGSKEFVTGHEVNVENTLILIDVEGTKTWDDAGNQDGKRPDSITVNLLADGEVIDTKTVTEADGWSWSFTDLPMYKDGVEVAYHIVEYPIPEDYSASLDGNNVINQYTPGQTSVAVVKIWDDQNDVDGIRPDSITVELYKNGEATGETLILNEDNNWIGSFTGLDVYTDGEENVYTVQEVAVEGYGTEMTGDAETVFVITNQHTPPEKAVDTDGDGTFEDDGIKVNIGDELTYQIQYYNYKEEAATVTITDTLDEALDFVSADNGGTYDESTRTITWTIENAEAQAWGEVTFKATVNDIGLLEDEIENYATVKIGNDSEIDTNIVKNPTPDEESTTPEPGTPEPGTPNPGTSEPNPGTSEPNPGTSEPNPGTSEPGTAGGSRTSDADLPILPIAGCCVAAALIAGALVIRRKRSV